MRTKAEIEQARRDAERSPVVWFMRLHQARRAGDLRSAERAEEALRQLGVEVAFSPSPAVTAPAAQSIPANTDTEAEDERDV